MTFEPSLPQPLPRLLAGVLLAAVLLPGPAQAASRRKGPYLMLGGSPSSMTVLWQLDGTATCTLEWGRDRSHWEGRIQTTEYGDHQHAYTIHGLKPGTLYHYRVTMGGQPYEGTFRTSPDPTSRRLKFMAYGDTRSQPGQHDRVAAAMVRQMETDPEYQTLLVVVGDLVAHGRQEHDWDEQLFDATRSHLQTLLSLAPYQSCLGNHELRGDGDEDLFLKYFPYRWAAPHYGSFDYGPAHFTYVDQFTGYAPGSPQYAWIAADLAATRKPWRFVVLHEPGWSAGGHTDNLDVQRYLEPLFETYGVAMVFAGHNHYYARAVVHGVQHITTGGGGAPLYQPHPDMPGVVAVSRSYHYCRVEIDGARLELEAVRPDGVVVDRVHLVRGRSGGHTRRALPSGVPGAGQPTR